MREIVSPDIYETRYEFMNGKSVWYYIAIINQSLRTNIIDPDGVINVKIKYNINVDIIKQVLDFYESVGWPKIGVVLTGNIDSLYGTTTFIFSPPEPTLLTVRNLVIKEL
jgi:hypothetical protein